MSRDVALDVRPVPKPSCLTTIRSGANMAGNAKILYQSAMTKAFGRTQSDHLDVRIPNQGIVDKVTRFVKDDPDETWKFVGEGEARFPDTPLADTSFTAFHSVPDGGDLILASMFTNV